MHRETAKDEEAQFLAATSTQPVPVAMRYAHLWKAAKTFNDAFEFDPLHLYIRAGVNLPPRALRRARVFTILLPLKRRQTMLTVNGGSAFVVAAVDLKEPKTPFDDLFDLIATQVWNIVVGKPTTEQQKRLDELDAKTRSVIDATIRNRIGDMIYISLLATEPASQGRGYGGSLVEAVNNIADSSSKASWLLAIDINESFYNSHGYITVGTYHMGEGNPNWPQKPVPVNLMVREALDKHDTSARKRSIKSFCLKSIQNPFHFLI